jgi:peptidoglycan/LPS O-acetylase OafA/YrhL
MRDGDGMGPVAADSRGPIARLMLGRSLADCIDSGRDNILQLRLIAALMVIVGHSFPVARPTSWDNDPMRHLLPQTASHLVGLMMFFTISGFLITLSFLRQPKLLRFLRARFLRIWPALAVCVTAWAFVFGPLLTGIPLTEYFAVNGVNNPYAYAWGNMSIFHQQEFLPGLFATNPIGHHVNGPLWTIRVETTLYLCVGGAGVLRLLRSHG